MLVVFGAAKTFMFIKPLAGDVSYLQYSLINQHNPYSKMVFDLLLVGLCDLTLMTVP